MSRRFPRLHALLAAALVAALALPVALQAAPAVRAPVVTGTAHAGGTLTAKVATSAAKGTTYVFQWQARKKATVRKKTVTRWVAIPGAGKATFVPPAALTGTSVRACVKAKGTKSAWKCSGAKVVAAAPTPATPTPVTPTPARPNPLSVSYLTQRFITGSAGTVLSPTITGGFGATRFSLSGTLPTGVAFDQATGTFTGPAASAWNFRATQIAAGDSHTCALTTSGGVKCWGNGANGQLGNGATSSQSTPVDVVATGQTLGGTALSGITQIAAGGFHTCALTISGGVKCWGTGARGRLGNGAMSDQSTPVDVLTAGGSGALAGITQIDAGGFHTCALTTSGGVKCWGLGLYGQLGNGATSDQSTPVDVVATGQAQGGTALAGITQIATGSLHTCVLTASGGAKCWGWGGNGELGNGSLPSTQSTPVDVVGTDGNGVLAGMAQLTAGDSHTCALSTPGGVKCWGYGPNGELGNGATPNRQSTPVDVVATGQAQGGSALAGITQIAAGSAHTCALTTSGGAKCWGPGASGQLGNGAAPTTQSTPVDVVATGQPQGGTVLSGITQIAAGSFHTCAVTTTGGVKCWGYGAHGLLGNGATSDEATPVDVTGSGTHIGFPAALTVTATDDTGSTNAAITLTEVSRPWFSYPITLFTMGQQAQQLAPAVSAGSGSRSFAISGTLPTDVSFDQATGRFTGPAASAWNFKATQIAAGSDHTCALTTSGGVKCWGQGSDGQLGNGATPTSRTTPVDVVATGQPQGGTALSGITQIAAGSFHTCAVTTSGGVKCWGNGADGQIGNAATPNPQSTPVDVVATGQTQGGTALSGITQIAAGGFHTCALTTSGGVKCWGKGADGQIGNGATPTGQSTPVDVVATGGTGTLSGITQIAAGGFHTCALTTSGGVKCWGRGANGQIGDGATPAIQSTPVDVVATGGTGTLSGITQIAAGPSHTCALTTQGRVKCWGNGATGQVGDGAVSDQSTPVDVVATGQVQGGTALSGITQIAAGGSSTCALTTAGGAKCWGSGGDGQLGNGATSDQGTPVDVVATGEAQGGTPLEGAMQIDAGSYHTCVLVASGGVKCWGYGLGGRLGNGAMSDQASPADVTRSGEQPGFPAAVSVTVTDDTGSWTLGRVVLGTR